MSWIFVIFHVLRIINLLAKHVVLANHTNYHFQFLILFITIPLIWFTLMYGVSLPHLQKHLTQTGLTLLAASSLPSKFWVEAFRTATFIINHIPSPVINYKSPFEVFFHKTPNYSIFKPFGCLCYPYLWPYTKTKLDFRSTPCIFLGYNTKYKGYKCITNYGKEYTIRHIIFDETQYPMITNPSFFAQNTSVTSTFSTLPPPIP